ncbi:MAG TPA: asparagine synthase (glutamine-hydrolyzing) [Pyrinomonadaceae bacterium]|nr:asparagine synthase (glutamine-hydrolyzing) [Pyrinomonadaceae bacterium]
MCGIFGIHYAGGKQVDASALERAARVLRHRGPDDEGHLLADTLTGRAHAFVGSDTIEGISEPQISGSTDGPFNLALGFRRLSILDLSRAGHQPMQSADGNCWIIFNGEIYNYIELRAELEREGYAFRTGTDTEVILAAYQRWGVDCLQRFIGMWAFALWDRREKRLFLARDPFGIKPLYYVDDGERFAFASEIKVLLECFGVKRQVNPDRVYDYLRFGITDYGTESAFAEIRQLPASHFLLLTLGDKDVRPRLQRYWQVDLNTNADLSFDEAAARLRELFLESIGLHLRSDVAVGTALSGGIDSSAIVTAMRHLNPGLEIHTFSYTADDPAVSEERWVDLVIQDAGAHAHKVRPTIEELTEDIDRLIGTQDEPFGSTSIYAQYRVFRLAHEAGIKVMLDGQGADELLAGYPFYMTARVASLLRKGRLMEANRFIKQVETLPQMKGINLMASAGGALLPTSIRRLVRHATQNGAVPSWLNERWFAQRGVEPRQPFKSRGQRLLQEQLHDTLVDSSLPMLLRYEDRNSMAHSVESRVPFLTTPLVEFIYSLPEEYLIAPDGTSKSVFRQAMRGIVPEAILERRDKIGFATPERSWLAALKPWVEQVFASDAARSIPVLNLSHVRREWEEILEGRRSFDFRVWRWLNLIRWTEQFKVEF